MQMANKDIADRGVGYGLPSEIVDGNDVVAVYEVTKRAVDFARGGGGPFLIEAKTMRMKGHAEHDDFKYVPKELLTEWAAKDPIARFEKYLIEKKVATEAELQEKSDSIATQLDKDVEYAENSPMPDPETAVSRVYADDDDLLGKVKAQKQLSAVFGD